MYQRLEVIPSIRVPDSDKIQWVEKINLPDNMIPVDVDMGNYLVVTCESDDDIFLFTCGLGPCIGIAARSTTNDGRSVLGVAHVYNLLERQDFLSRGSYMSASGYNKEKLELSALSNLLQYFQPNIFNQLISTMKKIADPDQIIDIYLGGGRGYYPVIHQVYSEYIKSRNDLRLCDTVLDPYKITTHEIGNRFKSDILGTLSTTFGITSQGNVILAKRINIDDLGVFNKDEEFLEFCASRQIPFPPQKELVFGFENLTWQHLHREDYEYEFDGETHIARKKTSSQYRGTFFSESPVQRAVDSDLHDDKVTSHL